MAKKRPAPKTSSNVVAQARRGKTRTQPDRGRWLWENVKSLLGAILIYLVIRTFLVEAYRIPSPSMVPTLLVGDWLFVNKLIYGPVIPFTSVHLPGYAEPHRFDVVVFRSPPQVDQPWDPTPTLVKRLIGMPGDTIYMRHGVVYVDGIAQRQGFTAPVSQFDSAAANEANPLFDWQHRIEVRNTRFGAPPATPTHDNWGPLLIPKGHYWMMGDNRYESKDSRYWGIVPRANFRGRPLFVYYTYRPADESDRPLSFITDIRWSRLGHWIH